MYPYIKQGDNIIIVIENESHTISKTHINYDNIVKAIKANQWDSVKELVSPQEKIVNYSKGNITIQNGDFLWKGRPFHTTLSAKFIEMLNEEFDVEPMVKFMENVMQNPSKRSVDELYTFIERGNMPITPDGCFLAFKKINGDYTDCHSGSVLNKPANLLTPADQVKLNVPCGKNNEAMVTVENGVTVVSMERNLVDDDKDRTCSSGLHFCSIEYLSCFGGERTVIVKINPRDVVSIPSDYNNTKGRTARYEVIGELKVEANKAFTKPVQVNANDDEQDDLSFDYEGSVYDDDYDTDDDTPYDNYR